LLQRARQSGTVEETRIVFRIINRLID